MLVSTVDKIFSSSGSNSGFTASESANNISTSVPKKGGVSIGTNEPSISGSSGEEYESEKGDNGESDGKHK